MPRRREPCLLGALSASRFILTLSLWGGGGSRSEELTSEESEVHLHLPAFNKHTPFMGDRV